MNFAHELEKMRPIESKEAVEKKKREQQKDEAVFAIVEAVKEELKDIAKKTPMNGQAFHCHAGIMICNQNDLLGRLLVEEKKKHVSGFLSSRDEWHYNITPFGAEVWRLVRDCLNAEGISISDFLISFDGWPEGPYYSTEIIARTYRLRSRVYELPYIARKDEGLVEINIEFSI